YCFYVLKNMQSSLYNLKMGTGIQHVYPKNVSTLLIPIPCPQDPEKSLKIQSEIVRILDKFSELTAELTARKKQYKYYREQLYLFKEKDIQCLPMGEIGKFTRGTSLQKKHFQESGIECIHYGQIYTYYNTFTDSTKSFVSQEFAQKARKAKYGSLIIATTSENDEDICKSVAWLGSKDVVVSNDACFYEHNLNPKYVAYFLQTDIFQKQKIKYITGTKVRRVNPNNLAKILIPIPSKEEQNRIVKILDRFNTLCSDISDGLPSEIKARQQQYEYYRNKLLTFAE
ncbi:MAG: restriction endonuclease subunit S, partial [Psittacicella sp.]